MALTRETLEQYLIDKQGADPEDVQGDALLFSTGVLDSFAMVDLMVFLEQQGGFRIRPTEVTLDHMDSIPRMLAFAQAKAQEG